MKKLLSAVILLALVSGAAWANIPDPDYCEVMPCDLMDAPRIVGMAMDAGGSPYWDLDIHIAAFGGLSLANSYVEVIMDVSCAAQLCYCSALDLTGYTNSTGDISFEVRLGGCCEATAAAAIEADDVSIRSYPIVTSPDLTSTVGGGDCDVTLVDFSAFGAGYGPPGLPGCTDYTGDDDTNLGDFVVFGAGWANSCAH